ncbi:MAG: DUF2079 domain-containing protein [Candidatus Parcubacteria bacterium]|nr:DUF2079 domain-containing protein [Candidatus Parcubacteria bacterium]
MFSYLDNLTWPKLTKITWILMLFFVIFIFAICLFKYFTYKYICLDLAIYNQVFFNSMHGRWFEFSFHGASYLGDHFEIIIFFLVPFYSLIPHPLTLVFMQACFMALTVIPLFLICQKHLSPKNTFFIICLYLFNPLILYQSIFEFHILPLLTFFVLFAFYFYDQNKLKPFIIFCALALLVREDVSFIIFMFGVLAILDKKKIYWILTPLIASTAYFFSALKISSYFANAENYKFLVYYSWLGNSLQEILANFFLRFPDVLKHIFSNCTHYEAAFCLIVFFLLLPLFRPKYLLLCLGPALEFVLGPNTGTVFIRAHYNSLLLPAFFIAAIFGLKKLSSSRKFIDLCREFFQLPYILLTVALSYNFIFQSPLLPFIKSLYATDYQEVHRKTEFLKKIAAGENVMTTNEFLTPLSSRPGLYYALYGFLNKRQYKMGDYPLPDDLPYIFFNYDTFIYYEHAYANGKTFKEDFYLGDDRLRDLLANYTLVKVDKTLVLWQKNKGESLYKLYETPALLPESLKVEKQDLGGMIEFLGAEKNNGFVSLYFKGLQPITQNYLIKINDTYLPLGYEILPTSAWQPGQLIKINFFGFDDFKKFTITGSAGATFNQLNNLENNFDQITIIGEATIN